MSSRVTAPGRYAVAGLRCQYFRLRPGQLSSVESDLGHNLAVLQEVLRVSKQYNPEFAKPYQEEFDNYRMAYGSVAKD